MHMRRTADRLLGRENYRWSVLGAGRNQMPIAAMARGDGRQCAGRAGGSCCGLGRVIFWPSNAAQVANVRKIIEDLARRSRHRTMRDRCLR